MEHYTAQQFDLPNIEGISKEQLEAHLALYKGYVAHTNTIIDQLNAWQEDTEKNSYLIGELRRRFGFEFDGMRIHEYYFEALVSGPQALLKENALYALLTSQFGSVADWRNEFVHLTQTRGSGWALLYYDPKKHQLINAWVDEHHLGHLASLPIVLAVDCWEHAYMVDHPPSGRGAYVEAYLNALNWGTVDKWFRGVTIS